MYSTCLFCRQSLGSNEAIEAFPVGRRIAFDAARGRLWVICRKCERWNLSPLEERWEAVETCERLFRDTRLRISTENIGLARLPGGFELVRIGRALRPEFAAWRYGDQFGRRRKRYIIYTAGGLAGIGALLAGGAMAGVGSWAIVGQHANIYNAWNSWRTRVRLRTDDGRVLKLRSPDLTGASLVVAPDPADWRIFMGPAGRKRHTFTGPEAQRVAAIILPKLNHSGGNLAAVQQAVRQIETNGGPESFLLSDVLHPGTLLDGLGERRRRRAIRHFEKDGEPALRIGWLPVPTRLAIEMALHEEQERRALEGELAALEAAWKEAEEIAAIADNLLVPPGTEDFLERHRSSNTAPTD